MSIQKLLRLAIFSFLLPCAVPANAEAVVRLSGDVRPTSQAVYLKLDARAETYRGTVRIELQVRRPVERFRFHSGPNLDSLALRGPRGEIAVEYRREGKDVVLVEAVAGPMAVGRYRLEVELTAKYTSGGGLYRVEHEGLNYVFSDLWPAARLAFPCWDEPAFKIPFDVTLTVPEGHLAITNSPVKETRVADGWRTVVFQRSKPLPTYDLAFAAGPLKTVPITGLGVPGRVVAMRGREHLAADAVRTAAPILRALESYFGQPYPYGKLDLIAVPGFPGAVENPGAVFFGESFLLLDPRTASQEQRRAHVITVAHELAHMWFGNLVTMAWWDDFWLNESFASWMGDKVAEQVYPELRVDLKRLSDTQLALEADARPAVQPIRHEVTSLDEIMVSYVITYLKGAKILAMFEDWLGVESFRRGVKAHLAAHAWGNATAADFWRALDESSGKKVSSVVRTFVEQPGFPLIRVDRLDGALQLHQQRFNSAYDDRLTWRVPLSLKLGSGTGVRTENVFLEGASKLLPLADGAAPDWIYPNADAAGYYRWDLPDEALRELAGQALTPRERFDFVANIGALLWAGELPADVYLSILAELAAEPAPMLATALVGALKSVRPALMTAEHEDVYAAYVRRVLGPALERFGLTPSNGEDVAITLTRGELYFLLGRDGRDMAVRRHAHETARRHLAGESVAPELIGPALRLAAVDGDAKLLAAYRERLATAGPLERRQLITALGTFADAKLQRRVLDVLLDGTLLPTESGSLFRTMAEDERTSVHLDGWIRQHFSTLQENWQPGILIGVAPLGLGVCSAERLADGEVFFRQHGLPGIERSLVQVTEKIRECMALRDREGETAWRYLTTPDG